MYQQPMSFWEATKLFWTRAFDFKGRSRRKEYWVPFFTQSILFTLGFSFFLFMVIIFSAAAAGASNDHNTMLNIFGLSGVLGFLSLILIGLILLIPNLSLLVRRLHDIGRSGKWAILFYIVPILLSYVSMFINFLSDSQNPSVIGLFLHMMIGLFNLVIGIWYIVWCAQDSQPGSNQWGPNPKVLGKDNYHNPYQSNYYQQNPYQNSNHYNNQDPYRR
ncbi:DUF805 domain-containing protein [Macrococcus sp. EM39E]|uniref:DUF805 domain-containing protein n=1 Tax=Macrococcus animalis TaxID=3395467 RepID=UPI0039BE6B7E